MVESEADQLSEKQMLDAVNFGHENMQVIIKAIDDLVNELGVINKMRHQHEDNSELYNSIKSSYGDQISSAVSNN